MEEKYYNFETSMYGTVKQSDVISYLVENEIIPEAQADTYVPTKEDIVNAIHGMLRYDEICWKDYGDRLFVDFEDNGDYEEV